jgi:RNA polymerase sigma-70 factor (ECF subfamily)
VPRVAEGDAPEAIDTAPGPEEAAAGNEERRRVEEALASLPADLRMVMVLRAVEGLSYAEIALSAGIPAGTVMSRLSRARRRLLAALGARSDGQGRPSAGAGRDAKGSGAPAGGGS